MESAEPPDDYLATIDDIREAIETLAEEDYLRIEKAARICLPGTEYRVEEEIINEAVVRAMNGALGRGGRHWPKARVSFVCFMIMTMKSISDGSRQSTYVTRVVGLDGAGAEATHAATFANELSASSPEQQALEDGTERETQAQVDARNIAAHFDGDPDVKWLISCLSEGKSASKTKDLVGLTTAQYEAARKRLRRGMERLFPGRRKR